MYEVEFRSLGGDQVVVVEARLEGNTLINRWLNVRLTDIELGRLRQHHSVQTKIRGPMSVVNVTVP
jgi:hypothetical protein